MYRRTCACNAAFKVQVEEGDAVGGQEGGERKRRLKPSMATREAYLGTLLGFLLALSLSLSL